MVEPFPDHDLVTAVRAGDRAAAEALVDRTYTTGFRVLCHLCHGDRDRAADLTQETYRRAWAGMERFEGRCSFSTWLCRIAYNSFIEEVRKPHPPVMDPPERDVAFSLAADQDESLIHDEQTRALRRAVLELPEDLRFAVVAHFWADATLAEIARLEGVTATAVHKRLQRALRALEAALARTVS